jgi:hypothetical protein
VYRDDKDAADALADQLKRDNADLERENSQLKEELAARPPATRSTKPRKRDNKQRKADREQGKRARPAIVGNPGFNWTVRIACGVVVAVASFTITRALYPNLHPGKDGLWQSIFGALLAQLWALPLIAQPILGWWPNEDEDSGYDVLALRQRVLAIGGGICAVILTAAFIAYVGESSGGL